MPLDRSTEGRWVDRGKPVELRLDPREVLECAPPVDQPARERLVHFPELALDTLAIG
ncbi:MAG: hypothetical protein H0T86_04085 [Gemmatimonadales bacterium]|nr:hypothetical protein [Gemmatimonadales bacterium]